jgi:arylsulfatase A-like enzyme
MRRRLHLGVLALALLLGWSAACERAPSDSGGDPDIVCIVIDTLRADHLPFYGYPENTAPYLSALASHGVVFRHAHSPSSWTAPATASIFTSVYPFQHQVVTGLRASRHLRLEAQRIPDGLETMPELLQRRGYRTFGATDNLNICEEQGFAQGFDVFRNHTYETAEAINRTVIDWTSDIEAAGKYFLYLHYMDPHVPYNQRGQWCARRGHCSGSDVEAYDSEIHYVDEKIGELATHFGWDDDTLILVLSDHGEEFGDHGGIGHGHTLYGELIDVPLLMSYPARWNGPRSIGMRISTLDLLPTIADLIGATPVAQHEGTSLLPLLDGTDDTPGSRMLYAHLYRRRKGVAGNQGPLEMRSLIHGDWKLITSSLGPPQLFNLADDPDEHHNRIDEHPDVGATLQSALTALEHSRPTQPEARTTITLSPADDEKLRALGYVD